MRLPQLICVIAVLAFSQSALAKDASKDPHGVAPDLEKLKQIEQLMDTSGLGEMMAAFEPYNQCIMSQLGGDFFAEVQGFSQEVHKESKQLCQAGKREEAQAFFDAAWEEFGKEDIGKISLACFEKHLKGKDLGMSEGMMSNPLIARQMAAQANRKPHICDQLR